MTFITFPNLIKRELVVRENLSETNCVIMKSNESCHCPNDECKNNVVEKSNKEI